MLRNRKKKGPGEVRAFPLLEGMYTTIAEKHGPETGLEAGPRIDAVYEGNYRDGAKMALLWNLNRGEEDFPVPIIQSADTEESENREHLYSYFKGKGPGGKAFFWPPGSVEGFYTGMDFIEKEGNPINPVYAKQMTEEYRRLFIPQEHLSEKEIDDYAKQLAMMGELHLDKLVKDFGASFELDIPENYYKWKPKVARKRIDKPIKMPIPKLFRSSNAS